MTGAVLCLSAVLAASIGSAALAADIRVMSGGAPKEVLSELTPQFEKKTGHKVHFTWIVISAMQQKLSAGEIPDMVLMPVPAIEARVKEGMFRSDAWAKLGTVSVGLAVREGATKPDIATVESFKAALLAAKSLVHAKPGATPSGVHLAKVWEQLGIADAINAKAIHRNALDGGVAAITSGEAEIGLYPLSEIVHEKGVTVVGLIPKEVQLNVFYGAAVLTSNAAPEPAAAFVKFLADPANAPVWKRAGFEPAAK